ncbi:hypothetical protein I4U23_018873 [Adineta vaga]|nr:hypothetical protein I4U23_018873 [Adineta vaga]
MDFTILYNGKPYNSSSGDFEDTIAIIANNPETICRAPIGIEVQSINYENEPAGVDFRVRYCCPNNILTSSTPETTTESSTCGVQEIMPQTNENTSESIYDIEAVANSWPWMIYVNKSRVCSNETCSTDCGAILIDKDHLITSAHCIDMIDPMNISLIAGAHRLSSTSEQNQRQLRSIKQIFLHPEYNSSINVNDIATSSRDIIHIHKICTTNMSIQCKKPV